MNVKFCFQYLHFSAWNAKVESEDEDTQMILLTWTEYDEYIQQTMQISATWNHTIDLNVIYFVLKYCTKENIYHANKVLLEFEQWKSRDNKEQKYKERIKEFLERRCCNHGINLLFIFLEEKRELLSHTALELIPFFTIKVGFPFVKNDYHFYQLLPF
ncbi:hypothetical protein RFI_36097 [Reticulomyxa filosa]|uniref:Uncharacterized protein n=1 Tax=Reticulomyxa filosa TaxID=46433 RepID=X6LJ09_RETFI|nr:hypothetical protein RFI_36097 [Reticulomyxa filosa]|eukprot:ETO01341.1 hypothetical protein RFI_36097 [Reticulomyxa filosa]